MYDNNCVYHLLHRRHSVGNIVLPRHHTIRSHVWPNGTCTHIHDPCFRSGMQRRYNFSDCAHDIAGSLRHVLR